MSDFLSIPGGDSLRVDQIVTIAQSDLCILFHLATGRDIADGPYSSRKYAAAALASYASTLASSFIALPNGPLLSISNIAVVSRLRNQVLFLLSTGKTISDTYADLQSAVTATAAYQAALAASSPTGSLTITSLYPAIFDTSLWTPSGWSAIIFGTGFTPQLATSGTNNLVANFICQASPGDNWVVNTVTFVNSTTLLMQVFVDPVVWSGPLGIYRVSFQDIGATLLPTPIVLLGAAELVATP
jgi:hypothetical protein